MARTKRREDKGEEKVQQKRKRRRKARTDGRVNRFSLLAARLTWVRVVSSDSDSSSEEEVQVAKEKRDVIEVREKMIH